MKFSFICLFGSKHPPIFLWAYLSIRSVCLFRFDIEGDDENHNSFAPMDERMSDQQNLPTFSPILRPSADNHQEKTREFESPEVAITAYNSTFWSSNLKARKFCRCEKIKIIFGRLNEKGNQDLRVLPWTTVSSLFRRRHTRPGYRIPPTSFLRGQEKPRSK